ncbi:uncharacterized protein [Apostichopus japonicus]|uniref:uncharacterized protein isoform X2 n=1 Tax=Stichopus japonicus TaxID=307972 RepID=UPI003AB8DEF2
MVAIKIIDKKVARADFYIHKNLRREAAILQQLRHPNIVSLLEVLETDNNLYLVLEICNGGPLLDLIWVQQGLSEEDARKFTYQVISAVQHLHNMGIMHRDLKVENLLLDEDRNIKLIDFGLSSYHLPTCEALPVQSACSFYDRNMTATLCGSPAYAAPEIISQKSYSPKVDVWSIGVNTFAMLTATLPFLVEPFNLRLLLRKMMNGEMSELPENISTDANNFVRYLLQPDPSCRPTIYEASRHPWIGNRSNPTPTPPLRRLSLMEIENDIIYEIRETFGIEPSHVMESVLARRADEFAALYYLLNIKKQRRWRRSMSDVRKSFDKLTMDLEDNEPTAIQDIVDYTTAMELARKRQGSPHFQMAMGMKRSSERLKDNEKSERLNYHDIYHEVLYEDENVDVLASISAAKVRLEKRKISDTCRLSHTTSVASGNPWVGLMGREMSLLEGPSQELVESFKVSDNDRKIRGKPRIQGNGKSKAKDGQKKVTTKKRSQHPISHVAPTFKTGKGEETELQLTTLGYQNSTSNQRTSTKANVGKASMESIQWNGDILRSKSKTNIIEKKVSAMRKAYAKDDVTAQPEWSKDIKATASPKKTKHTKQRTSKRKLNRKAVDEISRLYGTNRKASLALLQNRSKDKQPKAVNMNIHEGTKSIKVTPQRNINLCGTRLTRRAKTQGYRTVTRKGQRKTTNQNKEETQLIQKTAKDEMSDALPDLKSTC